MVSKGFEVQHGHGDQNSAICTLWKELKERLKETLDRGFVGWREAGPVGVSVQKANLKGLAG
jgi:hypothetical protein